MLTHQERSEMRANENALASLKAGPHDEIPKLMNTCNLTDINHENPFDSSKYLEHGVVGCIHKCSEGTYFRDPAYLSRKAQALVAGLLWGCYHFLSGEDPKTQLQNMLSAQAEHDPSVLLCLDWEQASDGNTATEDQLTQMALLVHGAYGRWPAIYGGYTIRESRAIHKLNPVLAQCPLWYQQYLTTGPWDDPATGFQTWPVASLLQYSDGSGPYGDPLYAEEFPGSDWNRAFCSSEELKAKWPYLL